MLRVNMALTGIITLCWAGFTTFPSLLFFSLLFGFSGGGFISLSQTVCAELFGIEHIATVLGIIFTSSTFGSLFSTPVAGWLFNIQSNYTIPIIMSGIFLLIGSIFIDFMSDKANIVRLRSHTVTQHHDIAQEAFLIRKHSISTNNLVSDEIPHTNISLINLIFRNLVSLDVVNLNAIPLVVMVNTFIYSFHSFFH